ncbi:hypothetical protein LTR51_006506 [Lithohypha guttulata]|nr:hypothetical protein LTR51_006506 [Lithohypha guttulata]
MCASSSRPIAPAPSPGAEETAIVHRSSANSSLSSKSGIKRASTACQSCKQIKRKCDQQHPCSNCIKTGTDCIYDQAQDGRRRAARKRNVEELELKRDALDTILESLRDPDDDNVQNLLRLIRSNAPLDEIIQCASVNNQYISEDQLASLAVAVDSGLSRKPMLSINALCDIPLIKVPARPWTNVTNDDDLVSHLISIYFTWFNPIYPVVARELFVAHMTAGDPNRQPLAVALTIIGKDRISTSYIDQMNDMAADLVFGAQRADSALQSLDMQKSLRLAIWSLYELSVITFMRTRSYNTPAVDRARVVDDVFKFDSNWFPYPESEPVSAVDFETCANLQYDLHVLSADIASYLFDSKDRRHVLNDNLGDFDRRLKTFAACLPQPDDDQKLNPYIMDINLSYHSLRNALFNFFKSDESPTDGSWRSKETERYAREQCILSARAASGLFKVYLQRYGSRSFTIGMPQVAVSMAYMLIEELDEPEIQDLFHDMCLIITATARKWFIMRGHARMLFITAEQKKQVIPERTRRILSRIALDSWGPDSHKFFETSKYPNYALARGDDPRIAAMGDLLERWRDFGLEPTMADTTPGTELDRARRGFAQEH